MCSSCGRASVAHRWHIKSGTSSLDESPVTGEVRPVDKGPGMKVFAASINKQGALEVEVTAAFADNTLSKIIHLVEEAQRKKAGRNSGSSASGGVTRRRCWRFSALFLLLPWLMIYRGKNGRCVRWCCS